MNVIAFPRDVFEISADQMQEIRDIGFTHYRHVEDDRIGQIAILRAAALILSDFAMFDADPMAELEICLGHLRDETTALIRASQDDEARA